MGTDTSSALDQPRITAATPVKSRDVVYEVVV
jgi:hypothetical protein